MKKKSILIYGEYSGYGKSLAKGFRELGYKAEVLSFSGDGFKKINDGLKITGKSKLEKLISFIKLIPTILSYKNVLVMNPSFFDFKFLGPFMLILFKLTKKNIILLCCGDDVEFIKQGRNGNIDNWPYSDVPLPKKKYFSKLSDLIINHLLATLSSKIVPVMYDYHRAWSLSKFNNKLTETIPLACDGSPKEINNKNYYNEKIVIMHGINREEFKGTKIIRLALDRVKKKYSEQVEIIYPEKLSLSEYLKVMDNVDIAIDQTKCNSYGMNAIYSMLSGHVVLAPANQHFKDDLNLKKTPIVSIENNEDSIYIALQKIIENPHDIYLRKVESQEYAINIHSPKIVAEKFQIYLK